ncbi:MAG: spore coat protein CotJB [Lachnospiraceae bacterium]|nr:spore coat protein CotJB [Lachnospiraceae bacterium]
MMNANYAYKRNMSQPMKDNYSTKSASDQQRLLHEIGMIDFVIVEMTEYLDTHPEDKEAIDYVSYYIRLKNKMMMDYAEKYEPLTVATANATQKTWNWVLQEPPWKGRCK